MVTGAASAAGIHFTGRSSLPGDHPVAFVPCHLLLVALVRLQGSFQVSLQKDTVLRCRGSVEKSKPSGAVVNDSGVGTDKDDGDKEAGGKATVVHDDGSISSVSSLPMSRSIDRLYNNNHAFQRTQKGSLNGTMGTEVCT